MVFSSRMRKVGKRSSAAMLAVVLACTVTTQVSAQTTNTCTSYGINVSCTSNFYGYNSLVNRPYTGGEQAYNYSVHLIKTGEDTGTRYRAFTGGRWKSTLGDGDHVLQWTSPDGTPGTWSMWSNEPEFYTGNETGEPNTWYSGNTIEPDVLQGGDSPWLMYTQVEIDPGQPTDEAGVAAVSQADRIMLLTSSDCKNWTRKSDRGVITNITDPSVTMLHHQAIIYVPWDPDGKVWWMYVCIAINGANQGYYRIRSSDYTTFDYTTKERSNMGDLGAKLGYLKQAPGGPLFIRIPCVQNGTRTVPAFQFSRDGLSWDSTNNLLLEGSSNNRNNKNCYFSGFSTLRGTGEVEYAGNYVWKGLYATTTSNSPTAPDIFYSEIGYGTFTLSMTNRAFTTIESPQPATYLSANPVQVSGWSISYAGLQQVDIYLDSKLYQSVTALQDRPDVQSSMNSYNIYQNALQSGYSLVIPAGYLSSGKHTLQVNGVSVDGYVQSASVAFSVK